MARKSKGEAPATYMPTDKDRQAVYSNPLYNLTTDELVCIIKDKTMKQKLLDLKAAAAKAIAAKVAMAVEKEK